MIWDGWKSIFSLLVNSTWHIFWWGSDWDWECLLRKSRKQSNLVHICLSHFGFLKVWYFFCQRLDVECGLALWFILTVQSLFSVGGIGCCLEFWRLQLCTLSLLITTIFNKMINQFLSRKSPRCKFCLFLLLIHLDNSLHKHVQNYSSLI